MSNDTITQSEAARRAGCSRTTIQKHLASGRIIADGSRVNLISFNEWLETRDDVQHGVQPDVQPPLHPRVQPAPTGAPAPEQVAHIVSSQGEQSQLLSFNAARTLEQNAKARLKQLEFDERSKEVVEVALVAATIGKEYAAVRRKLLALPAEHSPSIHRCKTVADVQERLRVLITRALEELTADGGSTLPKGV
ncbi:helix-turn-helix domain-containing protein [Acetobacter orientalis]|uniref:helix-turn-helix domain-containing protein n=1 Tax=Acetobacter orientalis TaxID=146474 RepID=UPI00209D9886|nr:helix-turn-helix domain-containing protein [Acetobacter orientalis]MCP1216793.1 helix-turn-helix domain-containing protein [Acetobacter orientalis]MCP1219520.1 helix-turn-helix domain-containing protein [Acetobacter orientalis]